MIESPEQLGSMVQTELERIHVPELREFLDQHLIAPQLHYRRWDYSCAPVSYPCWLVADLGKNDLGLAYSDYGHGNHDPWGVVLVSGAWFGRNDSWFLTLQDAVINSGCWDGVIPENYEIS